MITAFFEELKDFGVVICTKEGIVTKGNIKIYGINPGIEWYHKGENKEEFQELLKTYFFSEEYYSLLLSHSPSGLIINNQLVCDKNIDSIHCGHFHGGLVPDRFQDFSKKNVD